MLHPEEINITSAIVPVDLSGGANAGDWVSMKQYQELLIVFFAAIGTAGDDPVLTLEQATAVAGTNAKALNFTDVWHKAGTLTSVGTFTRVTQAAANTYTDATHAEVQKIYAIRVRAEDLDVAGGFDCVRLSVADVGVNAQIGCALYIQARPRYTPPQSSIVD